jgi:serine/threonine-protein kinase
MDVESWTRLSRLLDEALDLPAADRERWLASLGPEHAELKARVGALLAHASSLQASKFLDAPPSLSVLPAGTGDEPVDILPPGAPAHDRAGAIIGPYRLLRRIGEGGMGTVWLAERADGLLQREVALKLPRGAWPRADLVARMVRERNILAALTHPNIARLYDAGVTPGGRPYLALEYVEGRPIDQFVASERLDVRARVRVFLQVVQAVAYAHGQLIVHRDLKPSNILVTHDGEVRLLDFGVAKLLEDGDTRPTRLTEFAGRPHTPEYASPEQIAGEPLGIATDVYSLGVVLYELLAGARPYKLRRDSLGALETAILETDPKPPSTSTTEPSVRHALRGDLDTIVLKTLKKQPGDRYETANALGDDLQRYLDGRPVRARPDSARYRFSKFVRRNRIAAAAVAVVIVSLAAFAAVSAWQARVLAEQRRVAQIERDTAQQVVRVLIDLFETTNPSVRPDGDRMPLGEFLAGAQTRSLDQLRSTPAVHAKLLQVFGLIHHTRGQYLQARQALDNALAEQWRLYGPDHPESLESLQVLGELATLQDEPQRARVLLEESLERHRRVYGEMHERTARVLHSLATTVADRDIDEAGRMLTRALEIRRATLAPSDPVLAETLGSLGGYYSRRNDFERARTSYEQALAVFPAAKDRRHPSAITILGDLASLHGSQNRHAEAERLQLEAIEVGREVLGAQTLTVTNLVNNLGVTRTFMTRHADAERLYRDAYETHRSLLGENHWRTANVARNLGRSLALQERYAEALPWMDRAVAALQSEAAADPSRNPGINGMRMQRALVLFRMNRRQEALADGRATMAALERLPAESAAWPRTYSSLILGRMLIESGRPEEAEPLLQRAIAGQQHLDPRHPQRAEAICELARARLLQKSSAEEQRRLAECLPIYRKWGLAERDVVASLDRLQAPLAKAAQFRE